MDTLRWITSAFHTLHPHVYLDRRHCTTQESAKVEMGPGDKKYLHWTLHVPRDTYLVRRPFCRVRLQFRGPHSVDFGPGLLVIAAVCDLDLSMEDLTLSRCSHSLGDPNKAVLTFTFLPVTPHRIAILSMDIRINVEWARTDPLITTVLFLPSSPAVVA